jgi:hypothetical protein
MEQLLLLVMAVQVFYLLLGQVIQVLALVTIMLVAVVVVRTYQINHQVALVAVAQVARNKLHH